MIQRINVLIYIPVLLFYLLAQNTYSDEGEVDEESLKLLANVMQMELAVNLVQPGQKEVWNAKKIKYTISGYSVLLKVEGTNIKFHGTFTPYLKENNLLLIAQSQVWLSNPEKNNFRYFTFMKSISMKFNEKIIFLPLGIPKTGNEDEVYNIEIEILIRPYEQKTKEVLDTKQEQPD